MSVGNGMTASRAGLWRRIAALVIDCIVVGAAIQIAAIALYPLTNGRVQADGLIHIGSCSFVEKPPIALPTPPGFQASRFRECWYGLPFLPASHFMHAETSGVNESSVKMEGWKFRADRDGNVISDLTLDTLLLPLLVLWRGFLDSGSRPTLGRKALAISVVRKNASRPGLVRALVRQLLVLWPFLFSLSFGLLWTLTGDGQGAAVASMSTISTTLVAAGAIWIAVAIAMIAWRRHALHDLWSGTSVVIHKPEHGGAMGAVTPYAAVSFASTASETSKLA